MTVRASPGKIAGFTLIEIATAVVVVAVLGALAVPMWRNHLLRVHRADGRGALIAVQTAQDKFFGAHARYARGAEIHAPAPGGLGLHENTERGFYRIDVETSADGLAYTATATVNASPGNDGDSRCSVMTLDQNGRRRAADAHGEDRSADCWHK